MVKKRITPSQKRHAAIIRRRAKNGGAKFELLIRKTSQHMYATVLDLRESKCLICFSTLPLFKANDKVSVREACAQVGQNVAKYCLKSGIVPAINIANHCFHGLVKELVDNFSNSLKS